jgi:hypothetical protein
MINKKINFNKDNFITNLVIRSIQIQNLDTYILISSMTSSGPQKNFLIINLQYNENEASNLLKSALVTSDYILDFMIYGNQ